MGPLAQCRIANQYDGLPMITIATGPMMATQSVRFNSIAFALGLYNALACRPLANILFDRARFRTAAHDVLVYDRFWHLRRTRMIANASNYGRLNTDTARLFAGSQ